MGSLDEQPERSTEVSKLITINLPRSNPNIKADIDAELANGWHYAGLFTETGKIRIIFTRPKRRA